MNCLVYSELQITAGQRTMSGQNWVLTGQILGLPDILSGHLPTRSEKVQFLMGLYSCIFSFGNMNVVPRDYQIIYLIITRDNIHVSKIKNTRI